MVATHNDRYLGAATFESTYMDPETSPPAPRGAVRHNSHQASPVAHGSLSIPLPPHPTGTRIHTGTVSHNTRGKVEQHKTALSSRAPGRTNVVCLNHQAIADGRRLPAALLFCCWGCAHLAEHIGPGTMHGHLAFNTTFFQPG